MNLSLEPIIPSNSIGVKELVFVDDDRQTHDIVSWILKNSRHSSRLFLDPNDALRYVSEHQPKLLLVDFYMPGMNGVELIQALHERVNLDGTKIMLCSAAPPKDSIQATLAKLRVTHLDKGVIYNKGQLTHLLDNCLD